MVTQTGRLGDIKLNPARLDEERRGRLTRAALDYLCRLKNPPVKIQQSVTDKGQAPWRDRTAVTRCWSP